MPWNIQCANWKLHKNVSAWISKESVHNGPRCVETGNPSKQTALARTCFKLPRYLSALNKPKCWPIIARCTYAFAAQETFEEKFKFWLFAGTTREKDRLRNRDVKCHVRDPMQNWGRQAKQRRRGEGRFFCEKAWHQNPETLGGKDLFLVFPRGKT